MNVSLATIHIAYALSVTTSLEWARTFKDALNLNDHEMEEAVLNSILGTEIRNPYADKVAVSKELVRMIRQKGDPWDIMIDEDVFNGILLTYARLNTTRTPQGFQRAHNNDVSWVVRPSGDVVISATGSDCLTQRWQFFTRLLPITRDPLQKKWLEEARGASTHDPRIVLQIFWWAHSRKFTRYLEENSAIKSDQYHQIGRLLSTLNCSNSHPILGDVRVV